MRLDSGQYMRIDQRMKLAPQMIQSMEILQMPSLELEERIEQELTNNPTLELREPGADSNENAKDRGQEERDSSERERELVVADDKGDSNNVDDFERLTNISEEYGDSWSSNTYETGERYSAARQSGERDKKMDALANTAERTKGLADQLLSQWSLIDTTAGIDRAGQYLIGFIDDDGYLRTGREVLLNQAPGSITSEDLDGAWELIKRVLEPVGIGSKDLRECLLLQIQVKREEQGNGALGVEEKLVKDYLKDIETNRLPKIAQRTGLSLDEVKTGIRSLRQFYPHPGRLLVEDRPRMIRPDATVEYDEEQDRYVVQLTHDRVPSVQLSRRYMKMAKDQGVDTKVREFVNTNLRSARWLIEAIQQRQSTLLRVINVVLEAQREYFDQGAQHLKPLPMTLVADQLGIHVATVSRAVSEKYLQTSRGIVSLRKFFSGGMQTGSGDAMSWSAIQAKLKQVIDEEDKNTPLSDDQLVEKLKEQGIEIARRTVAKYRKQLNIAPARQRREY